MRRCIKGAHLSESLTLKCTHDRADPNRHLYAIHSATSRHLGMRRTPPLTPHTSFYPTPFLTPVVPVGCTQEKQPRSFTHYRASALYCWILEILYCIPK